MTAYNASINYNASIPYNGTDASEAQSGVSRLARTFKETLMAPIAINRDLIKQQEEEEFIIKAVLQYYYNNIGD